MNKYFLFALVVFSALLFNSCDRYCSCTMPGAETETIEIQPTESCAEYSNANRECH